MIYLQWTKVVTNSDVWQFIPPYKYEGVDVIPTLRIGDYDLDGFPDIVTVVYEG